MKAYPRAVLMLLAVAGWSTGSHASPQGETSTSLAAESWERNWSLVTDGSWMALLTVDVPTEGQGMWTITPLEGPGFTRGAPVRVMPVQSYVPIPSFASAVRLSDGRWAFTGEVHGGGSHILQYAVVEADLPFQLSRPEPLRTLPPDLVSEVELERGKESVRLLDLQRPSPIELGRQTYIVASGRRGENVGGGITWVAEATMDERVLRGWFVCEGVDARVTRQAEGFVVAVRVLRASQALTEPAPVRLYRSSDLHVWEPLPSPDEGWRVSTHALLFDGELWLLGVRQRAGAGEVEQELLRFQPAISAWTAAGPPEPLADWASSNVELLPRIARKDGEKPATLYREASGRMSVLRR